MVGASESGPTLALVTTYVSDDEMRAGLATAKTLLKYAADCGVGASLATFSRHYSSLTKLLTVSAPDEAIVSFAKHREANPQTPISAFHFFPFGGFKKTADWANKVVAGNFEITDGGGLKVE